ncbi:PKD domain-containing protein [Halomonas stenophila]|uniref:PKD/Chitinase domain-containing protein n=1 Tax=Halomonas stenophila TaxID=795312 RepID=A0A7W5HLA5_9GAMM|nr:PKD domain-containing protein [Halomonas stenophila]MBB3231312.1 hypothetical protein [Halomonas stenophila]
MWHLLKHPLLVAVIGGLVGSLSTWITFKNTPPVATIIPENVEVGAAESVTFDAKKSHDPDGSIVSTGWLVSGHDPKEATSIAACTPGATGYQLICRFVAPGTHSVGFSVTDNDDTTANTSTRVTVNVPGGYIGVVLQFGSNADTTALEKAFNYGVDWTEVQALLGGRLIVLRNADTGQPVLANAYQRSIEKAREYAENARQPQGLRILASLPQRAADKVASDLQEIGVSAHFVRLPAGEIMPSLHAGLANSSFVTLESPQQLTEYYE